MQDQTCRKCGVFGPHRIPSVCRECERARRQTWKQAHRERHRAQQRAYKARRLLRDPEYAAKRWPQNTPEEIRAHWQTRREWIKQGNVTGDDLRRIYAEHDGKCAYCGTHVVARFWPSQPAGFDHVIPRANGGTHTPDNLVVCCKPCNVKKSTTSWEVSA